MPLTHHSLPSKTFVVTVCALVGIGLVTVWMPADTVLRAAMIVLYPLLAVLFVYVSAVIVLVVLFWRQLPPSA